MSMDQTIRTNKAFTALFQPSPQKLTKSSVC